MAKQKGSKIVVHEVADRHRIVILNPDGTNEVGEWTELRDVANLKGYFAITGQSALPQGVFTCREVTFQMIG